MKSFNRIAFGLACITFLALVVAPQVAVQTSAATLTVHQFQSVLAYPCNPVNGQNTDFCVNGSGTSVESVLNSASIQGYQLFSASPWSPGGGCVNCGMVYTLRK
jgi:hypothetical protein